MASRTFSSLDEAAEYVDSLDDRWPARSQIVAHLAGQVSAHVGETLETVAGGAVHVVELCSGACRLGLRLLADEPQIHYTGIDVSPMLLALASGRLATYSHRTVLVAADLNEEGWLAHLPGRVTAFVSLQSLHDLGDAGAVARIFRLARTHLSPGGKLIYADLLADPAAAPGTNPGRMRVEEHLARLADAGFVAPHCTLELGPFGCFVATVPNPNSA